MHRSLKGENRDKRSVVITSMGFVSPLGNSSDEVHQNILTGNVVFERPEVDPTLAVLPVRGFDVKTHTGRCKEVRYLNRGAALALASAMMAVNRSGLDTESLSRAGLFAASGPNMDITRDFNTILNGRIDEDGLSALFLLKYLPNTATSLISRLTGVHGENMTLGSACAASLMAIGEAFRKIRDGYLDIALVGGGDSRLSPVGLLSYSKAGALWKGEEDPKAHYRPFGTSRKGFIPGEGGAFFVLESLDHAKARKAKIMAEIKGFGSSIDGHAMTAPKPDGEFAEKAVRQALSEASLSPLDVDLISAHGTGTDLNDRMEAALLTRVFKESRPKITTFKPWIGHLASACGAVELALCLSCVEKQLFPGLGNLETAVSHFLDFIRQSQHLSPQNILLENFGFGGQNSALVVSPWNR